MWFLVVVFFFFKQKTAYELRISDWSSDVCSSDLRPQQKLRRSDAFAPQRGAHYRLVPALRAGSRSRSARRWPAHQAGHERLSLPLPRLPLQNLRRSPPRSEEHTSELQSLMRNSYAVFCLKKTNNTHSPPLRHIV